MLKVIHKALSVHSLSGIAAFVAIIALLAESDSDILDLRTLGFGAIAVASLASGFVRGPGVRGRRRGPSPGGRLWIEKSALSAREKELVLECLDGASMKAIAMDQSRELAVRGALLAAEKEREDRTHQGSSPPRKS